MWRIIVKPWQCSKGNPSQQNSQAAKFQSLHYPVLFFKNFIFKTHSDQSVKKGHTGCKKCLCTASHNKCTNRVKNAPGRVNRSGRSKFPGEKQAPSKKETRRLNRKRSITVEWLTWGREVVLKNAADSNPDTRGGMHASMLAKSYSNSILGVIWNIYIWARESGNIYQVSLYYKNLNKTTVNVRCCTV